MYAYLVYKMHLTWKYIHVCLDLSHIISGHFLYILAFPYWENLNIFHMQINKKDIEQSILNSMSEQLQEE